ncbi:MAG: radical SAM protein, partial [Dissulfurimicrobium sp.]
MPLLVAETFLSLQGEGVFAGRPCFFIRLSGCNLRCNYCDTTYAYSGGEERELASLLAEWQASGVGLVEVTGGEPLLQKETVPLMETLLSSGATVLLETNGSLPLVRVPRGVIKIVDRKTPGSGMKEAWHEENTRYIDMKDQIKFVITGRDDYEWAVALVRNSSLFLYTQVLFSPAWRLLDPAELAS